MGASPARGFRSWAAITAITLLGATSPALAGCGAKAGESGQAAAEEGRVQGLLRSLPVLFPTIPIEIGTDGRVARVAGFSAKAVDSTVEDLTGNPLFGRIVYLDKEYLEWFDRQDLQHVTVALQQDGVFLLANGMPLPGLAWDEASMGNLVDLLGKLRDDGSTAFHLISEDGHASIEALMPALSSLNLQFDIRFPDMPAVGAAKRRPIPTPTRKQVRALRQASRDREASEPMAAGSGTDVAVRYEPLVSAGRTVGWVPSFAGFSTVDLQRMLRSMELDKTGKFEVPRLMLRRDIQRRLALEGITLAGLELREDGLYAQVNGRYLPHLAWEEDSLSNFSTILEQLYPDEERLPEDALWVPALRDTLPSFNDFDLRLNVEFPEE